MKKQNITDEMKKLAERRDDVLEGKEKQVEEDNRKRPKRKTTYERVTETQIPKDVKDYFLKDDWELRWVRWTINGEEDYRNLGRRLNEGYEFVKESELPPEFLTRLRIINTGRNKGIVTSGDVCLMKADVNLVESRRQTFNKRTDLEVETADIFTLSRKKGFKDLGSKSKVTYKEPTEFQK